MKVLVAYDGTLQAKDALRYGLERVRNEGGEVIALHVFQSSLFIDYDAHPMVEEIARRESARFAEEASLFLAGSGSDVKTRVLTVEGNPEEEIMRFAREKNVDVLLCPPRYRSIIRRYRKASEGSGRLALQDTVAADGAGVKIAMVSFQ